MVVVVSRLVEVELIEVEPRVICLPASSVSRPTPGAVTHAVNAEIAPVYTGRREDPMAGEAQSQGRMSFDSMSRKVEKSWKHRFMLNHDIATCPIVTTDSISASSSS